MRARQNLFLPAVQYSTENVLKLRGSEVDLNKKKILYDATLEKDSCGVGLIANLKSIPSRHVVETADEMLVRMAHRGGCGCDPNSGDGAGKAMKSTLMPRTKNPLFDPWLTILSFSSSSS
jgi:hypothetical protein